MRTRSNTTKFIIGAVVAAGCMQAYVAAADQGAQQAVETRQHNLKELGGAFKEVRDQMRKPQPDMAAVTQASGKIAQLVAQMNTWFPAGSGPAKGIETDAKPEIWSDPQGFSAALTKLQTEGPKLQTLAKANDVDGLKKQVGAVGGACKGCHDKYRVPEE
jgi:cytochrome c556